jgi:hypothetical protein
MVDTYKGKASMIVEDLCEGECSAGKGAQPRTMNPELFTKW